MGVSEVTSRVGGRIARVLIIAGSDSGGGAGIQADIKTVTALGAYAASAVTALTAQNTRGVHGVMAVAPAFVAQQIACVLEDIGADCLKTGMLVDAPTIAAVAEALKPWPDLPLVLDPVMVAKGGAALLDPGAVAALKTLLLPRAAVVTPNLPEAEALSGIAIRSVDEMRAAAAAILKLGPAAVLLKGGHLEGPVLTDLLVTPEKVEAFTGPRIESTSTHGTGCTTASAIAAGLAQKMTLAQAVSRARAYVAAAIRAAPGLGAGHGPLHHGHAIPPYPMPADQSPTG